jgi:hypothetical protein
MSNRVYFSVWGMARGLEMPAYAMREEWESRGGAVARAIARKNGLHAITCRADSGIGGSVIYQATLGHRCRGGGWTPTREIWIAV